MDTTQNRVIADKLAKLLPAFVAPTAWGKGIKKAGNALLVWEGIKTLEDVLAEDRAKEKPKPSQDTQPEADKDKDRAAAEAAGEGMPEEWVLTPTRTLTLTLIGRRARRRGLHEERGVDGCGRKAGRRCRVTPRRTRMNRPLFG